MLKPGKMRVKYGTVYPILEQMPETDIALLYFSKHGKRIVAE